MADIGIGYTPTGQIATRYPSRHRSWRPSRTIVSAPRGGPRCPARYLPRAGGAMLGVGQRFLAWGRTMPTKCGPPRRARGDRSRRDLRRDRRDHRRHAAGLGVRPARVLVGHRVRAHAGLARARVAGPCGSRRLVRALHPRGRPIARPLRARSGTLKNNSVAPLESVLPGLGRDVVKVVTPTARASGAVRYRWCTQTPRQCPLLRCPATAIDRTASMESPPIREMTLGVGT